MRYRRYHLYGRGVSPREPIHLGAGEPILLLHPFMMSSYVWKDVAPRLADTGRFEVFAPTMAGHNGGPPSRAPTLSMGMPRTVQPGTCSPRVVI